ncbi:MAG: GNAT family N-acetyltransferase [Leptospiraceae bacterium]|nr:GNAT family N-acetyltransferase [Leptospiraceae bacterium]
MITKELNIVLPATRNLEVRLAENQLEVEQALALRYEVFNEEMGEGLLASRETKKDRDNYDYYCHHLIVLDKDRNNKVVGTYRILPKEIALKNIGFYSENEFDLTNIYSLKEGVAEVGRSCVHPEYRGGSVISLLWIGLGTYMKENNIRYLMGCGSIHNTNPLHGSEVYAYLKHNQALAHEKFFVHPKESYKLLGFDSNYVIENIKETNKKIPPLIKGYIRLGAKISGFPALDLEFGTIDVFVIFDSEKINEKYGKHYL